MKKHMFFNFLIGYLIFGILSFFTISLIVPKITYKYVLTKEADNMYKLATFISSKYSYVTTLNSSQTVPVCEEISLINHGLDQDIMIIKPKGQIILDTNKNTGSIPDFNPSIIDNSTYAVGDFFGYFNEDMLIVMAPVNVSYSLKGYVLIHKPTSIIARDSNSMFNYNYITMLIMLIFSLIFVVLYVANVFFPIKKLTKLTNSYASGDFTPRSNSSRNDELGQLAHSLDYMAGEIEKLNDYQDKLIANISHDFRSPLTSIKGYVEAMIDGTIPIEMQEKYLNIVIFETERLTKLTNNLLSLNRMSKGMILENTSFDINKMIKQTLLTFEGTCSKKKLQFNLTFSEKEEYVYADYGKIQQVMYNLIDNAIKFSNINSFINITTTDKSERVIISVKDFGIGIPKDSLERIWDRFYKTDQSRGKDKKGIGLGLSIVKEILTAHKTTIDVISTEGTGTEFIFSLPKPKQ